MTNFKTLILILFFFLISTKLLNAADKISILDIDSLLEKTNFGKKIILELNSINGQNLQSLKKIEAKIKTDQDNINKQKNLLSEDELNKKVKKLNTDIMAFQKKKKDLIKEFNIKKKNKLDEFFKMIIPEIETYVNDNNISLVIDKKNIFIANRKNNITEDIVKIIDEKLK
tara:strand:- start:443 stop:955 length:513 start_codon:yes stop_codon:yes gene_type:complete